MGANIFAKTVNGVYAELKFNVRDGFHYNGIQDNENGKKLLPRGFGKKSKELKIENLLVEETKKCNQDIFSKTFYQNITSQRNQNNNSGPSLEKDLFTPEQDIPCEFSTIEKISVPLSPNRRVLVANHKQSETISQFATSRDKNSKKVETDNKLPMRTSAVSQIEEDVNKGIVLIVDDHPLNRSVMKSLLKLEGFNSLEAKDGKESVLLVEEYINTNTLRNISLIFMDLQMPIMNGIQAVTTIREMCQKCKCEIPAIIGISSDSSEEDRRNFLKAGLNKFVSKPITKQKLSKLMKKYTRSK